MDGMGLSCEGVPLPVGGGTWIGHVIPGAVFLGWGIWWAVNAIQRHLQCQSSGRSYTAKPWYPLLLAGRWLRALEPFLKILGGPIGVSIELYFDSPDGFRPLYCTGNERAGQFAPEYSHNYQHASSYPAFLISGLVDFLGMFVTLPPGTEQGFLALAFGVEGFLMVLHKKHIPLDAITHELLGYTMLAGALGVILELRAPSFMTSMFRAFAVIMQGIWLIAMGEMMFTGSKAWNDDYKGPAMLAPPFFAMLTLLGAVGLLVLWLALSAWHTHTQRYMSLPLAADAPKAPSESSHDRMQFEDFSLDDSANETSDDGSDHNDQPTRPKASGRTQIATAAINILKSARQKTPSKSSEHII